LIADVLEAQTLAFQGGIERCLRNRADEEFTLDRLGEVGLSLRQQKELREACPNLADDYSVPARQDLSLTWETLERHIRALGAGIEPYRFNSIHIAHVAPVILGSLVWSELKGETYRCWQDLKDAVNARYGFT
jgi:hypothetical protein